VGPLGTETARRWAGDATVTRVLVTRHPAERLDRDSGDLAAHLRTQRRRCCPGPLAVRPPNRWRWAAPPGWSPPPNAPRWGCGMVVAGSPAVTGRWPGATPTTCATGSTVAPPTSTTWCWCAAPTTTRSTRAAGACTATPTSSSPPHHPTDDDPPPHDAAVQGHEDIRSGLPGAAGLPRVSDQEVPARRPDRLQGPSMAAAPPSRRAPTSTRGRSGPAAAARTTPAPTTA
jgi:hypothetical protein